jgi:hypothetical protein
MRIARQLRKKCTASIKEVSLIIHREVKLHGSSLFRWISVRAVDGIDILFTEFVL